MSVFYDSYPFPGTVDHKYPAIAAAGYEIPTPPVLSNPSSGHLFASSLAGRGNILCKVGIGNPVRKVDKLVAKLHCSDNSRLALQRLVWSLGPFNRILLKRDRSLC
jgi:hypothetical protein